MSETLALEVISGPMDGKRVCLTGKNKRIGRDVGNALTLTFDLSVSRNHAEVALEGPVWCLIDHSRNGTWLEGACVASGSSHPLKSGNVFLIGSTIIEVFALTGEAAPADIVNDDICFRDPRDVYQMDVKLENAWQAVFATQSKYYCDTSLLFACVLEQDAALRKGMHAYLETLNAASSYDVLGDWLSDVRPGARYWLEPGMMVAPRIWEMMDRVSEAKTKRIGWHDMIGGILDEKRNLAARIAARDMAVEDVLRQVAQGRETSGMFNEVSAFYPNHKTLANARRPAAPDPAEKTAVRETQTEIEPDFWQQHVKRFEEIILSFVEDAMHPGVTVSDFRLPGFDEDLLRLVSRTDPEDPSQNNALNEYLYMLEKALWSVLAAHRDVTKQMTQLLMQRFRTRFGKIGKKSFGPERILQLGREREQQIIDAVFEIIKQAEQEGMAEELIRDRIKNALGVNSA